MSDFDFKGKRVLVRAGTDVPVDDNGNITDDKRIRESIPTVKKLLSAGAKQVILACHMGRPKEFESRLSTKKVAERYSELLGVQVKHVSSWSTKDCEGDKVVMLENLRFNKGEKSKDANEKNVFGKELSLLADYYVNDAFSNSHRDDPSMSIVPLFIPGCTSDAVENEVSTLRKAIDEPERPMVSIIGGAKADKLNAIRNLLGKADKILIGGALAFIVFKAFGKNVGTSKVDDEGIKEFESLVKEIKDSKKIVLPVDCVVADSFSADAQSKVVLVGNIPDGWMALDLGPKTIDLFKKELSNAKTIVWNGPLGVFEFEKFSAGTREIAGHIAGINAVKVIGGGDSAAAVSKLGFTGKMTLVSTGGGASLEVIEGKELPAIKALEESYKKFKGKTGK